MLNAKHHENEAYVVAQAGRKGAITVSTNMAGRGTDIILGGNPEMLAKLEFKEQNRDPRRRAARSSTSSSTKYESESCKTERDEVVEAGGLHILGTERHESRRIDNQLRGRAGRQGDPGSSRFYLSLEDDLMRIFAGDRVKTLDGAHGHARRRAHRAPVGHAERSRTRSSKVEGRNFDIRKNLLEYDDVMNQQRKTVYKIRQQLLLGIYTPERLGDDGKPTGKLRKIEPLERLSDEVKQAVIDMVLHFGTPMPSPAGEMVKRPKTVDEVEEIFDWISSGSDIYQFWGYRFDFKET